MGVERLKRRRIRLYSVTDFLRKVAVLCCFLVPQLKVDVDGCHFENLCTERLSISRIGRDWSRGMIVPKFTHLLKGLAQKAHNMYCNIKVINLISGNEFWAPTHHIFVAT